MAQITSQSDKSKELKQTLDSLIENYRQNPEEIAELLAFKNRFYSYSMNNNILIFSQNPAATFVASYGDWKKKGYQIQKGQHGIKIIFPIHTEIFEVGEKDGKKQYRRVSDASPQEKLQIQSGLIKPFSTTRFGVGNVFDISQTDCPAKDYPKMYHTGYSSEQHSALYDVIKSFSANKGNPVIEKDLQSIALRGQFSPHTGEIEISDKLNDTEKLSTLTHELGHALLHSDPTSRNKNSSVKELEADCISIMLQQEMGIELTENRKKHFVQHYNVCKESEDFKLEDVLKNVSISYLNLRNELDPIIKNVIIENQENNIQTPFVEKIVEKDAHKSAADAVEYSVIEKPQSEPIAVEESKNNKKKKSISKLYQDYQEQDAAVLNYVKHNVSILTIAKDMGFTPEQIGGYYTLKEHDSVRIYPDTNSFHRFSTDVGGSTVDFAMHFGGLNQKEAIQSLKDKYVGNRLDSLPQAVPVQLTPPAEPKKFELPEKAEGKFARAFAYLTKTRCLDADIVQRCMKDGLVYEDNKHNVVFVGNDADGNPVYATRHTTLTNSNFKRDVAGSRQDVGFMIDNKAERLYVTEAPIDALSIMCLRKHQGQAVNSASYMATCGTGKDSTLYYRLKHNPNIKEVILANDNDEAGQKANKKILEHLHLNFPNIRISCLKPKGKDVNEHLCTYHAEKCNPANPKRSKGEEVVR